MADSKHKNKSGLFECAANALMTQAQYLPVPHSAYYSCYQLIKHLWLYKLGKTEAELEAQISQYGAKASHEYLINQIIPLVSDPMDRRSAQDFRNKLLQLKVFRTRADYTDITIDYEIANDAIKLMNELLRTLRRSA